MKYSFSAYAAHYRALVTLGTPIVVGQLGMIILGFADTLMIGHHSMPELAAASFVNNLFNLCIIFSTGFSYGLTPVVGAFFGNGNLLEAGRALRCSLVANTLVAMLIVLVMGTLYFNVHRLGQPEELLPLIRPYYLVLLASMLFVLLFNGFKQFTDGITYTRMAMWILLGGNALNIAGNYVLINGKLGFPELGLLGAGLSTLFARIVMVAVFAWLVLRGRRFRRYRVGFFRRPWSGMLFRRLNALGWPVGLQMGMETASFSLSTIMVGWLGTVALASHQVMLQLQRAGRCGECASLGVRGFPPDSADGGGVAQYYLQSARAGRRMVYGQCRGDFHGVASFLSFSVIPVWRWFADYLCQCLAWHFRCPSHDVHGFCGLFCHFASGRLSVRLCARLGSAGCVDGFPFRSDQRGGDVLVAFPSSDP